VAILGVGNLFRSDDAAGILVTRALSNRDCAADTDHILILEAGQAPENATWELRKFAPDLVLFVDAAQMGERPGAIRWIPDASIDSMSASTHSLPLSMVARYLTLELGCRTAVLGIQVHSSQFGEKVSDEVLQAVNEAAGELDEAFGRFFSATV
jgi:hydrogenase 3 maturation protease